MTDLNNSNLDSNSNQDNTMTATDLDTTFNQENNMTENTNTPADTLENMIATAENLRMAADQAQLDYEDSLRAIARDHGATLTVGGQVYQIRHRKESRAIETVTLSGKISPQTGREITYLCALRAEPKTWLTGRAKGSKVKKGKVQSPEAATMASAVSSVLPETEIVPETGGATVIE